MFPNRRKARQYEGRFFFAAIMATLCAVGASQVPETAKVWFLMSAYCFGISMFAYWVVDK